MAPDEPVDSRFQNLLQEFEQHIREEADLERLKVIRRKIRKTLPLSVRAYLPAYLLQEAVGAGVPRKAAKRERLDAKQVPPPRVSTSEKRGRERLDAKQVPPPRVSTSEKRGKDKLSPKQRVPHKANTAAQRVDGQVARLFVSVGRNRRVSRQGLIDLFVAKIELKQEDISDVSIFENYSFIELPAKAAESAIEKISGETLNGRRLSVDYARSKKS